MEVVAYALRHNLETAYQVGIEVDSLNSMGGAVASPLWMQIKSNVTGKVIYTSDAENATTLGAAILAGIGTGIYQNYKEAVESTVRFDKLYYPDPATAALYDENYHLYLNLYQANKELMRNPKGLVHVAVAGDGKSSRETKERIRNIS